MTFRITEKQVREKPKVAMQLINAYAKQIELLEKQIELLEN